MSHPRNKKERKEIGNRKGKKRILNWMWFKPLSWSKDKWDEYQLRQIQLRRDTTKLCGGDCCRNPRRSRYNKNKDKLTNQEKRQLESEKD
jgi:hypothetical protein